MAVSISLGDGRRALSTAILSEDDCDPLVVSRMILCMNVSIVLLLVSLSLSCKLCVAVNKTTIYYASCSYLRDPAERRKEARNSKLLLKLIGLVGFWSLLVLSSYRKLKIGDEPTGFDDEKGTLKKM